MPIDQLANYAEIFGGIAVVVSLIYVALQVRANTREQRLVRIRERAALVRDLMSDIVHDSELRGIMVRANESYHSLPPEDAMAFSAFASKACQSLIEVGAHRDAGSIDPSSWQGFQRFGRTIGSTPGMREWWEENNSTFGPKAKGWLEELMFTETKDAHAD